MLCSGAELQLNDESGCCLRLPEGTSVGMDLASAWAEMKTGGQQEAAPAPETDMPAAEDEGDAQGSASKKKKKKKKKGGELGSVQLLESKVSQIHAYAQELEQQVARVQESQVEILQLLKKVSRK